MKNRLLGIGVLLVIFIPLLCIGGFPFSCAVVGVALIGMHELLSLRNEKKKFPLLVELIAYLAVAYITINNYSNQTLVLTLDYQILSLLIFAFFFPVVIISDNEKYNLTDAFFLFGATLFLGLSFHLIIMIRNYSLNYFILMILITTMSDTFAYISGSMVGRHKLCPKISPKKTVEGLIVGTIMSLIAATMYYLTVIDPSISLSVLLISIITLSLIGQIGDLVFSAIKRYYNKKDFSNLIPGHGGVLDRFDSIIFVALAFVIFIAII